jgi:hypothetical protein
MKGHNPFRVIFSDDSINGETHTVYGAQVPDGTILRFEDRYGNHTTNLYMYIAAEKIKEEDGVTWLHPMR